ncbi:MAG: His-Xaa-Ser system protein HxsD [Candidatus Gracilibacteria bacterium]|nr:His-Xaa-Ser system protein HxsD [Candidatus Gracilibacteria bacterium]
MEHFLVKKEGEKFELLIDNNIFNKDIVLKAAYNFLDKGYFFFKLDNNLNIILQFSKKNGILESSEKIIGEFSDELLSVYLRDKLEHENKIIREMIIGSAIANSVDDENFVEFDTNTQNQIDFDKDIDEILREIENDPELKIDEAEIERILREIEEETSSIEIEEPKIDLDTNNLKNVKEKFQNR